MFIRFIHSPVFEKVYVFGIFFLMVQQMSPATGNPSTQPPTRDQQPQNLTSNSNSSSPGKPGGAGKKGKGVSKSMFELQNIHFSSDEKMNTNTGNGKYQQMNTNYGNGKYQPMNTNNGNDNNRPMLPLELHCRCDISNCYMPVHKAHFCECHEDFDCHVAMHRGMEFGHFRPYSVWDDKERHLAHHNHDMRYHERHYTPGRDNRAPVWAISTASRPSQPQHHIMFAPFLVYKSLKMIC